MAAGTRQAKSVGTASSGGPSAPVPMHPWYAPMVFVSETYDMPLSQFLSCTDGIIRTRYRDSTSTPSLVEPGRAYGYTIDLWATSNVFKAGHRIRVEVSSSNFPRFDRNTNTGRRVAEDAELTPALQTILHSAQCPSHITLPIVPR